MALGRRDELIGCHSRLEVSKVEKRCTCGYIDSDAISGAAKFLRYFIITVQFFKQRDSSGVQRQKLSAEVFFFLFLFSGLEVLFVLISLQRFIHSEEEIIQQTKRAIVVSNL